VFDKVHETQASSTQASSKIRRGTMFIAISYQRTTSVHDSSHIFLPHLLEQQFRGVRNGQLCHFLRTLAVVAPPIIAHQATFLTRIDFEFI
jgi:hypothetical protein